MKSFRQTLFMAFLCIWVAACAVGPDFRVPDAPVTDGYTPSPLPETTVATEAVGGTPQKFVTGRDIPRQWWMLFQSEALDQLIRQALEESPSLALARARLRESRENRAAQFGAFFPSADVNASAGRQKLSGAALGQGDADLDSFSLLNASIGVTYTLDIFGGQRRQLEALDAQVAYQEYQLEGAHLILTSNIVTAALLEASLRKQLQAYRTMVDYQQALLQLVEKRYDAGGVSYADVLTQRAQLAQAQAAVPELEKNWSLVRHQLAVLVGKLPSEIQLPEFDFAEMSLPEDLPVSLPSALVRQRPDIRAAEAVLHRASAEIGVATANLYPKITLSGLYGYSSNSLTDFFDSRSMIWNFGAGLAQPLFRGGALTAKRRAAIAIYDQALAQYRLTILQSFQNIADVLRALEVDAAALQAQARAELAARSSLDLIRKQYELGAVSYLYLLNAQRQYQETYVSLIRAQAARYADTAALFVALGGGWWNKEERPADQTESSQEKNP